MCQKLFDDVEIFQWLGETFSQSGGAQWESQSMGCIPWGPFMSVKNYM